MRLVFMGSSAIACPSVSRLRALPGVELAAVITQPERAAGRGRAMAASPLRESAGDRVPVLTMENVNAPENMTILRDWRPDAVVVVSFGQLLRRPLLELPPKGCINLHPSLLPRYRGAAPIAWAVAAGETVTGVTIMFMNERMDAGDILLQREVPIGEEETAPALRSRLAEAGASLLAEAVELLARDAAPRRPQDDALATFAPKLQKRDGRVDWTLAAAALRNRVRAFQPWPGCFCEVPAGSGHFLKILRANIEASGGDPPGRVLDWSGNGPLVQTGNGALRLTEVQPEGRKAMAGSAYLPGHPRVDGFG